MSRKSKKQPSKPQAKPPVSLQTTVVHTIHKPPVRPAFHRAEPFSVTFRARRWQITFVCLALICATLLVYVKVGGFGFIDYDDPAMVKENSHINTGLTWDNIAWAFTDLKLYYWHPLTYLSHMLDCQLFGLDPGPPHQENVIIHALNAGLLFLLLLYMTGFLWRSAFVSALFALHPLRVESVAWITERRDVLCGLFSILALLAYTSYTERPASRKRFAAVFAVFCLAIMSKPMAITLPLVMLLLDRWPLRRLQKSTARQLIVEKIPLFVLAALSVLLTMIATSGAVISLDVLPVRQRITSAFAAYAAYLGKFFWPKDLAIFYPHVPPGAIPLLFAGLIFVVLTALAVESLRRRPYLFVGWFWFLLMLLPVIGLVQSGGQFIADRFTYLPLLGPSIAIVWFVADWLDQKPRLAAMGIVAGTVILLVLSALSFRQTGYWSDKFMVYRHTLDVTTDNERMWYFYARALAADGHNDEAEKSFRQAIRLAPMRPDDHEAFALLLTQEGKTAQAIQQYREVIRVEPENLTVLRYLAMTLIQTGSPSDALPYLRTALRVAPDDAGIRQLGALVSTMTPATLADSTVPISNVPEAEDTVQPPPPMFWSPLTGDESLQLGLLLGLVATALIWPRRGSRAFAWFERLLVRISARPWRAICIVALLPMAVRILYLPIYPVPEPTIHDEFGYLLLGDTFASGRVANPPHPMADFFESIYILQNPSYTSYYPFAPGLMLAPALFLSLNPWLAVWLSVGIMCAAFYWMLAGWMPPRWALLGALLAGARFGVLSHWMNSYWGGTVAAIGGALVFGALPRIFRGRGARYAVLLGVGIAILAQSRPYEGFLVAIPVGIALLAWIFRSKKLDWRSKFVSVLLPLGTTLLSVGAFFAYYNWRVTGHAFQLPYQLYQKLYGVPQSFYWQRPVPPGTSGRFSDLEQNYQWQLTNYNVRNSWRLLALTTSQKLRALWAFYLQPVWTLPLLAVPWLWSHRRLRILLLSILFVLAGVGLYPFFFPHYLAPVCGAFLVVVMYALRRLRLWEWRSRPIGLAMARAVVVVSAACLVIAPAGEYMMNGDHLVHRNTPRQRILNVLQARGGRHLVFVHYGPNHLFHNGLINNAANIDSSAVVWARDLGESRNQDLLRYYPDRTPWMFDCDEWPVHLLPYPSEPRSNTATAGR